MQRIEFARVFLFTHDWLPAVVLPDIEIIDIGPLRGAHEHSTFVMRQLPPFVRTSHVLLTQWDGFVADPRAWNDEFLVYDYTGAVWPEAPAECCVGDGAFSLRSRRFLAAGQDPRITETHPEDEVLCGTHRDFLKKAHGVIFAPPALARQFARAEPGSPGPGFGFHGVQHLPHLLPEAELSRWLDELPASLFAGPTAPSLLRALLVRRMPAAASKLLARGKSAGGDAAGLPLLGAATRLLGALSAAVRSYPPSSRP